MQDGTEIQVCRAGIVVQWVKATSLLMNPCIPWDSQVLLHILPRVFVPWAESLLIVPCAMGSPEKKRFGV